MKGGAISKQISAQHHVAKRVRQRMEDVELMLRKQPNQTKLLSTRCAGATWTDRDCDLPATPLLKRLDNVAIAVFVQGVAEHDYGANVGAQLFVREG